MSDNCYLCGGKKCSVEHVPAKCFFPEDAEYRMNLITVPSCKDHNENTSRDDEYVRNIICMSIGNNAIAYKQFIDKVIKSFEHSPALQKQTLKNTKQVYIKKDEEVQQTFAFKIDIDRFDKVMKKIGYALYYHEFGMVWQKGLIIFSDYLLNDEMQLDELGELISHYRSEFGTSTFDGDNPKVFQYKFQETNSEDVILWMKFYEGFEVFVVPKTDTNQPDIK